MRTLSAAVLFLGAMLACGQLFAADAASQPVPPRTLKVGVLYPLSGELAVLGQKMVNGAKLAAAEAGQNSVTVVFEDSGSTGASVTTAVRKLIDVDGVDAIVGPATIDQGIYAGQAARSKGVPVITNGLCSPKLTALPNVVCAYPSSEEQLAPLGPLAAKLGVKTLAVISEQSEFAIETKEIVERLAKGGAFQIVSEDTVQAGENDFKTLIARVRAKKPAAVFAVTADPAVSFAFFKQLRESGYGGERIGYLDADPKYLDEFGASIDGVYLPGFVPNRFRASFVAQYRQEFGSEPDMYGALGYDLLRLTLQAITAEKSGAEPLLAKVVAFDYRDGAVPGLRFRPDRTVTLPLEVWTVRDHRYLPVDLAAVKPVAP